jgi:Xaa-Pro dipeptidase
MEDERLQRTIAALRESGADWAVLSGADSIAYALGYAPAIETGVSPFAAGPTLAVVSRDGAAGLLALRGESAKPRASIVLRYDGYGPSQALPATSVFAAAFADLLHRLGVGGRLAIEAATHPAIADSVLPAGERADLTGALRRQRMTKTAAEIHALRHSAEVAAAGQRRMIASLRARMTELELFADIRRAMETAAGARITVAGDLVSGRERTAAIGGWPTERVIQTGDAVICDLGPRVDGYWGDSCATVVLGAPTEAQERLFRAARRALDCAVAEIMPGMTAQAVHRMIREVVKSAGFDYPHHTGHGIGAAVHEHPRLCEDETTVLRAGMVLMVEPGAYDPTIGGVRTEWMLHLTETGCVPLAPFPLVVSTDAGCG